MVMLTLSLRILRIAIDGNGFGVMRILGCGSGC